MRTSVLLAPLYDPLKLAEEIVTWDINSSLTLRNIVSLAELESYYRYDGDGTTAVQYDTNPFGELPRDDVRQTTEELQLQGRAFNDRLSHVAGVFYYKNKPNSAQGADQISYCP